MNRPGGNITGMAAFTIELDPKRLELLNELAPPGPIGLLLNPTRPDGYVQADAIKAAANASGRQLVLGHARNASEIDAAIAMFKERSIAGFLPGADAFDLATARYTIDGNLVHVDRVSFEATTVEVVGSGLIHYDDRSLDLELYSRSPADPALGPLSELINVFKDELLTIHVTGTLEQPQTNVETLSGIGQSLTDIFGPPDRAEPPPVLGAAP